MGKPLAPHLNCAETRQTVFKKLLVKKARKATKDKYLAEIKKNLEKVE